MSPPRYNSRFFEPEAEWLNSFSCHWDLGLNQTRENNWIHPPYAIMGRTQPSDNLWGTRYNHFASLGGSIMVANYRRTTTFPPMHCLGTSIRHPLFSARFHVHPATPTPGYHPCNQISMTNARNILRERDGPGPDHEGRSPLSESWGDPLQPE